MKDDRCVVASIKVTEQWFAFRYVVTSLRICSAGGCSVGIVIRANPEL